MNLAVDNFFDCLKEFFTDLKDTFPEYDEIVTTFLGSVEKTPKTIRTLYDVLMPHSKNILLRNDCIFDKPLQIIDGLDLSEIRGKMSGENKHVILDYMEHLYVLSYLCLFPDKKDRFLKVVYNLKSQATQFDHVQNGIDDNNLVYQQPQVPVMPFTPPQQVPGDAAQNFQPPTQEHIQNTVGQINQILGVGQGGDDNFMGDMINDIAQHVGKSLQGGGGNPQDMLMSLLSGDMSMFGDLIQDVSTKFDAKIQNGEIDEQALFQQTQQMMQSFQGIPGMANMANMAGMAMPPATTVPATAVPATVVPATVVSATVVPATVVPATTEIRNQVSQPKSVPRTTTTTKKKKHKKKKHKKK